MTVPNYREIAMFVRQHPGRSVAELSNELITLFPEIVNDNESNLAVQCCIATQSVLADEVTQAGQQIQEPTSFRRFMSAKIMEWRNYLPF